MSSENLDPSVPRMAHLWNQRLDPAEYLVATYQLETSSDPELAAIAMAKEQSAGTLALPGSGALGDLDRWTARVVSTELVGESAGAMLPGYRLKTPVYEVGDCPRPQGQSCCVRIAYPIALFARDITCLCNVVGGELFRLGFVNALRLTELTFPDSYLQGFAGPKHGLLGIRQRLGVGNRPIFCRSTRPAVGLSTQDMLRINESVLRGGFDVVKDDELTPDTSLSPFSERVEAMVSMIRRVQDAVGERKMYFANVIGEVRRSLSWARTAARAGVDGLLVSPMLQGLEIARVMAEETGLPVLAHNTLEDIILRHPRFGVSQPVYMTLQRIIGADLLMLPGAFSTGSMPATEERACIDACAGSVGKMRQVLPILAGGKTPDGLAGYLRSVGSPDFMLIAAAAVDHHAGGLEAGARAFREACESFAQEERREIRTAR